MKSEKQPKILVTIRKRPLTRKEKSKGDSDVVIVEDDTVTVNESKEKVDLTKYVEEHRYKFDRVYDHTVSTEQVNSPDIRSGCVRTGRPSVRRSQDHSLRLRSDRVRQDVHDDGQQSDPGTLHDDCR